MDRRIIKTRNVIKKACLELINEKGFETMTILDIAERANINRGTFYLHYIDKYDLLDKYEQELSMKLEAVMEKHLLLSETLEQLLITRYPTLVQMFYVIKKEHDTLMILLQTKGIFALQEKIKTVFIELFEKNIHQRIKSFELKYPLDFLALFVSSTFISVLQYWIQQQMKYTPEELAKIIIDFIANGPIKAIGIPSLSNFDLEYLTSSSYK